MENCLINSDFLCDMPSEWRDGIIKALNLVLSEPEDNSCQAIRNCQSVVHMTPFVLDGDTLTVTFTDENGITVTRTIKITTVINNALLDIDPKCLMSQEEWDVLTLEQKIQVIITGKCECCPPPTTTTTTSSTTTTTTIPCHTYNIENPQPFTVAIFYFDCVTGEQIYLEIPPGVITQICALTITTLPDNILIVTDLGDGCFATTTSTTTTTTFIDSSICMGYDPSDCELACDDGCTTTTTTTIAPSTTTTTSSGSTTTTTSGGSTTTTTTPVPTTTTTTTLAPTTTTTTTELIDHGFCLGYDAVDCSIACEDYLDCADNVTPCSVLVNTQSGKVYSYDPETTILTERFTAAQSVDIAHTATKLYLAKIVNPNYYFSEYDITLSPFSATFVQDIILDRYQGVGFTCVDDYTVVSAAYYAPDNTYYMYSWDLTGGVAVRTILFEFPLGATRGISGDVVYNPSNGRYIVSMYKASDVNFNYITQFSPTGVEEFTVEHSFTNIWGMYVSAGDLYAVRANGEIYLVEPSGLTLVNNLGTSPDNVFGASQLPECTEFSFETTTTTTTAAPTTTTTTIAPTTTTTTSTTTTTTVAPTEFTLSYNYTYSGTDCENETGAVPDFWIWDNNTFDGGNPLVSLNDSGSGSDEYTAPSQDISGFLFWPGEEGQSCPCAVLHVVITNVTDNIIMLDQTIIDPTFNVDDTINFGDMTGSFVNGKVYHIEASFDGTDCASTTTTTTAAPTTTTTSTTAAPTTTTTTTTVAPTTSTTTTTTIPDHFFCMGYDAIDCEAACDAYIGCV